MRYRSAVAVPALALFFLLGLVLPIFAAETIRAHKRDALWAHQDLDGLRPHAIGLLPAIAFVDDRGALSFVESGMIQLCAETGHECRPASFARDRMATTSRRPDSLYQAVAGQVRRAGHVDPATAALLASLLGVESTMSVRIDRWEVVSGRAMVELTAALVDASGRLLWKISGLAGYSGTQPASRMPFDSPGLAVTGISTPGTSAAGTAMALDSGMRAGRTVAFRNAASDPGTSGPTTLGSPWASSENGEKLSRATYNLLARWAPAIPPSPRKPTDADPARALAQKQP